MKKWQKPTFVFEKYDGIDTILASFQISHPVSVFEWFGEDAEEFDFL